MMECKIMPEKKQKNMANIVNFAQKKVKSAPKKSEISAQKTTPKAIKTPKETPEPKETMPQNQAQSSDTHTVFDILHAYKSMYYNQLCAYQKNKQKTYQNMMKMQLDLYTQMGEFYKNIWKKTA